MLVWPIGLAFQPPPETHVFSAGFLRVKKHVFFSETRFFLQIRTSFLRFTTAFLRDAHSAKKYHNFPSQKQIWHWIHISRKHPETKLKCGERWRIFPSQRPWLDVSPHNHLFLMGFESEGFEGKPWNYNNPLNWCPMPMLIFASESLAIINFTLPDFCW